MVLSWNSDRYFRLGILDSTPGLIGWCVSMRSH
jgi:hypothetical protein